jgi:Putative zinc-finger
MDHLEAVRLNAAEKYLLGELSAELRDQYEDHFFDCKECAQDVRGGAAFVDNARDLWSAKADPEVIVRPEKAVGGWWSGFLRPSFAAPALALLLLVAAYQNAITIPRLKSEVSQVATPQTLPSFSLITLASRGGDRLTIIVPVEKPFSLFVDIPPKGQFSSYLCEFQNDSGKYEFSVSVSPEEAKQTVQLLVPPGRLSPGSHVLVLYGLGSPGQAATDRIGLARIPFTLELVK